MTMPHVDPIGLLVNAGPRATRGAGVQARIFRADPLLLWSLEPNVDHALWEMTSVSTNSQGLRYPRDVGPKEARAFRILCLGDSVTFGFRVPRVPPRDARDDSHGEPYPLLVEAALRAANPGRTIEVIPLAVPGYSSHQGLAWLRRDIDRYSPDLVTACFGWNDVDRRARTDGQTMRTDPVSVAVRRLLCSSQSIVRAGIALRAAFPPRGVASRATTRVPSEEYVQNLLDIARLARSRGAFTVLIGPVFRDRFHPPESDDIAADRAALRAAAQASGIPYLEVPELTEESYPANERLFEDPIHPNYRGHHLLARRLLHFLADKGVSEGPPGLNDQRD